MKLSGIEKICRMNKHILYLNYILYIYRSDEFIWGKLCANILAAVFCPDLATTFPHNNSLRQLIRYKIGRAHV